MMQKTFGLTAAIAALSATTVNGETISTCASGASDVCFGIGVPSSTASSTTGNLYMQISAPTTYSWVAFASGSSMKGSNMFIVYQDGQGNVTVSSRQGTGESQPQYSASTASDIELMAGSGVTDGKMIANIRCSDCQSWSGGTLSTSSTSAPWISAWKTGSSIDSSSPSESIQYHDSHSQFDLDLTQATISSDSNPFTSEATTTVSSSAVTVSENPSPVVIWAHGLGMAICFAILYPLGSALMPILGKWWFHAGWQMITWVAMWVFFGLGVSGAKARDLLFNNSHTLLGTVVVCLLAVQPVLGQLHHQHYLKNGGRGVVSYVHLWWGRSLLLLGLINGGLGLQLTHAQNGLNVAYALISLVMYGAWIISKTYITIRKRDARSQVSGARAGYVEQGGDMAMRSYPERHFGK